MYDFELPAQTTLICYIENKSKMPFAVTFVVYGFIAKAITLQNIAIGKYKVIRNHDIIKMYNEYCTILLTFR